MPTPLENAQAALNAAQAELAAVKASKALSGGDKIRAVAEASKAVSAAERDLAAAKRGIDITGKSRQDVIGEIARLNVTEDRKERAETMGPLYDPTMRPDAPPSDGKSIFYYSWIGDQWRLYRQDIASASPSELKTAESRSVGGRTAATFESIAGANTLVSPGGAPQVTPTGAGGTGATGGAGGVTGRVTGGAGPMGGATGAAAGGGATSQPFTVSQAATPVVDTAKEARRSAYDLLFQQFNQYGLGSLVTPLQGLIQEGISPSEFTIRLRDTAAYKQRFGANQARIQKGLRALSEAEYIGLEDQYQNIMRTYGLPSSYYSRGEMGRQEGFEKFLSADVSPAELEDRIQTAYNRVVNANPEVGIALRNFYPSITNGDILAYALDPERALTDIKRKITAAEIGGAAVQAGLTTNESDAEYLARYGITKEQAQQGYRTISGFLPRAQQLSSIYERQVEGGPYTQASAEREVFGTPGAAEEERKRQRITQLEQAAFAGASGTTGGALGRERAGQF